MERENRYLPLSLRVAVEQQDIAKVTEWYYRNDEFHKAMQERGMENDRIHQAIDTAKREWAELMAQYADNRDSEIEHENRDGILLRFMFKLAPDLAKAMKDREEEVGYWYA